MRIAIIISIFFLFIGNSYGQQLEKAKEILVKINEFYQRNQSLNMELEYRLFKTHTADASIDQKRAIIRQNGLMAHFILDETESITDGHFDLLIDNTEKTMVIANHAAGFIKDFRLGLDTLLNFCKNVQIDDFGNASCLFLPLEFDETTGVAICFDEVNFALKKIVLYYRSAQDFEENTEFKQSATDQDSAPRLEVYYLKNEITNASNTDEFQLETYVTKTSTGFKLSKKYSQFRLIDQTFE